MRDVVRIILPCSARLIDSYPMPRLCGKNIAIAPRIIPPRNGLRYPGIFNFSSNKFSEKYNALMKTYDTKPDRKPSNT